METDAQHLRVGPDTLRGEAVQCGLHVYGVPKHDHIDDQPQGAQLIFLALPVGLAEFAAVPVEHGTRQAVPGLTPVQLNKRCPAFGLIVSKFQGMQSFFDPAEPSC